MKYILTLLLVAVTTFAFSEAEKSKSDPILDYIDNPENPWGFRVTNSKGLSDTRFFKDGRGINVAITYKIDEKIQATMGYVKEKMNSKNRAIDSMELDAYYLGLEYTLHSTDDYAFGLSGELGRARQGTSDIFNPDVPSIELAFRGGAGLYSSVGAFYKYKFNDAIYGIASFKHRDYGTLEGFGGRWTPALKDDVMETNSLEIGLGWEF